MFRGNLKLIYKKLNDIDLKVSALLLKEERPTKEEQATIRKGEKEFKEGKYSSWEDIKAEHA